MVHVQIVQMKPLSLPTTENNKSSHFATGLQSSKKNLIKEKTRLLNWRLYILYFFNYEFRKPSYVWICWFLFILVHASHFRVSFAIHLH